MSCATIGPYRLIRQIGEGGQGRLLLGYDDRLHRRVAVKLMPLPAGEAQRDDLLREARALAAMDNARIVRIHDVLPGARHVALIMEYVPGCDLEDLLAETNLSLSSILTVAADVAAGLACARQAGIVHGDIKPANILITTRGRARLTDFGIARLPHDVEDACAGGSRCCMAPELVDGGLPDRRTDLFALGCVIYRMLSGYFPFYRDGTLNMTALLCGDMPPLGDRTADGEMIPPHLASLVQDLLEPDPARRPCDTHRVRQLLRQATRARPVSVYNPLLREAVPCFRPEEPQDLPVPVPHDFLRTGVERGPANTRWRPNRWLPACVLAGGVLILVLWILSGREQLRGGLPEVRVAAATGLPGRISTRWLESALHDALTGLFPGRADLLPTNASREGLLDMRQARGAGPSQGKRLALEVQCSVSWCVLELARLESGGRHAEQVVVQPGMPVSRWRSAVERLVTSLYR